MTTNWFGDIQSSLTKKGVYFSCPPCPLFARHGGLAKGDHQIEGINSRLDGLQAEILSVKLPHLRAWTARR